MMTPIEYHQDTPKYSTTTQTDGGTASYTGHTLTGDKITMTPVSESDKEYPIRPDKTVKPRNRAERRSMSIQKAKSLFFRGKFK